MENAKEYWDELERRYFDGETTEAEEAELERHIAELAKRGTVNATTATIAYTAVGREVRRSTTARTQSRWGRLAAAASIALLMTLGAAFWARGGVMTGSVMIDGECVAEADGALDLMRDDLALLAEVCPQVDEELTLFLGSDDSEN